MKARRIIAFAYACEPESGSEPGAGWAWARMLATMGETWVITRANNRPVIEAAIGTTPERDALHFVYVDLPSWSRGWKRGQRGVRLYYLLWQIAAVRRARRLREEVGADLAWHVTLANAWLGSLAPLVGLPFVYGPVGGGVGTPWRMLEGAHASAYSYEVTRSLARLFGRALNPAARLAWSKASLILALNEETREWLPARHRRKAVIFQNAVFDDGDVATATFEGAAPDAATALFAGRLIFWKRADLAIRAIALTPNWRLVVCGNGPENQRLKALAQELEVGDRVEFRGWVSRESLLVLMRERATALIFPSLHDDAPWTVAEALACGLPVVSGDRGGPPAIAGHAGVAVRLTTPDETARALAAALMGELPSSSAAVERGRVYSRSAQAERLKSLIRGL